MRPVQRTPGGLGVTPMLMPASLISLLVAIIVFAVLLWAVQQIMRVTNLQEPLRTLIYVVLVLILVFWLLGLFGVWPMLQLQQHR